MAHAFHMPSFTFHSHAGFFHFHALPIGFAAAAHAYFTSFLVVHAARLVLAGCYQKGKAGHHERHEDDEFNRNDRAVEGFVGCHIIDADRFDLERTTSPFSLWPPSSSS